MQNNKIFENNIFFKKPNYKELKKQGFLCVDMHYHSNFSDGAASITQISEKLKKLDIGISLTDHNEINGIFELKKNNIFIVPGIEVKSDELIDILFYFYDLNELKIFYTKEILPNKKKFFHSTKTILKLEKLLKLSKKYNCITSLAHPFGYSLRSGKNLFEKHKKILLNFDNIEIINGGNKRKENLLALDLAKKYNKGFTAGSDGHSIYSLGKILTCAKAKNLKEFLDAIKNRKNIIIGNETDFGKYGEYFRFGFNKLKNIFSKK